MGTGVNRFCITALMLLSVACQCGESQPGLLAYIRAQPQWTMQTQRLSPRSDIDIRRMPQPFDSS